MFNEIIFIESKKNYNFLLKISGSLVFIKIKISQLLKIVLLNNILKVSKENKGFSDMKGKYSFQIQAIFSSSPVEFSNKILTVLISLEKCKYI